MSPLAQLVRKHGVNAKLKAAIMRERGWKPARFGSGAREDWYVNWPAFSVELEAAVIEAKREGPP